VFHITGFIFIGKVNSRILSSSYPCFFDFDVKKHYRENGYNWDKKRIKMDRMAIGSLVAVSPMEEWTHNFCNVT